MNVLAISGRHSDAAAAVCVDGRVVAAVAEEAFVRVPHVGYERTGGFPGAAAEACLRRADLEPEAIDRVVVVDAERHAAPVAAAGVAEAPASLPWSTAPARATLAAPIADAWQAAAWAPAEAVLVCGVEPPVLATFVRTDGGLAPEPGRIAEAGGDLFEAAQHVAGALGVHADDPIRALDRLSLGGEPEWLDEVSSAIVWSRSDEVRVKADRLEALLSRLADGQPGTLADHASLNERVKARRRALAASVTVGIAGVMADAAERLAGRTGAATVALGGAAFGNPRMNAEVRRRLGASVRPARVPEAVGRAIGAAVGGADPGVRPATAFAGLALGPAFRDSDVKATLDNCRLDYLYEPDWPRLLRRVSRMLAQGKLVAWFQGPMAFGPRSCGTRSILADPSGRFVRQNVNEYLRRAPLDEPLPVMLAPSAAAGVLDGPLDGGWPVVDAGVRQESRRALAGAIDSRGQVRIHPVSPAGAPALCDLLETHLARTGVPGLVETNLCAPGEPLACTPRDAIRTVYSSAIDALVIDRFVLMKDHWLLRADAD